MIQIYLFYTPPCQPCKVQKTIIEELLQENPGPKFEYKNAWEEKQLTRKFNVRSSPVTIILKDGEIIGDFRSLTPKEELQEVIHRGS